MSLLSEKRLQYPEGAVTRLAPAVLAAVIAPDAIYNRKTIIDCPALAAHSTINLTIDSELEDGAELVINLDQGGTGYNLIAGTGIVGGGPTSIMITGVLNDKDSILLQYDRTAGTFRVISVYKTKDAA